MPMDAADGPVARLEKLRQQIELVHYRAAGKAEFLAVSTDPDRAHRAQALHSIELDREREAQLTSELHKTLQNLRDDWPAAVEAWAEVHRGICRRICENPAAPGFTERELAVRRDLARSVMAEWDDVTRGRQDFVRLHEHLLADYRKEVGAWLTRTLSTK